MGLPSILAFGSQMGFPDPNYLSQIRNRLLQDPHAKPLLNSIIELPSMWVPLVDSCTALSRVPGRTLLEMLRQWIENDRAPYFANPPSNTLLTPLTFICQVVEYLTYLREVMKRSHSQVIGAVKREGFQGLCIGMLSAAVAGCAKDEVGLLAQAAIAVRTAVLIGATVDADGHYATPPRHMTSIIARCGEGCDRGTIDRILERYPEAYISIVSDRSTFTITAPDSDLPEVEGDLCAQRIITKPLNVHGRFHNPVHREAVDALCSLCNMNKGLFTMSLPNMDIRWVFDEILCMPSNWDLTLSQVLPTAENATGYILSVGPVNVITESKGREQGVKIVSTHETLIQEASTEKEAQYPEHAIAVVGIGCKFPGAASPGEFWELLKSAQTKVCKVPEQRIPSNVFSRGQENSYRQYWANFVDDVDSFDHKFFGKSPREAATMDPQQRILLEVTHQAIASAGWLGQPAPSHPREDVGCFIGCGSSDYNDNIANNVPGAFSILGALRGLLSGRISHHFGWEAPSITYDTACASSMVAIHAACTALLLGECSAAVAGGVNILTSPMFFLHLDAAGFLNQDGASRAFDAQASGYCRGEGAGIVVLKRLQDALVHGDVIHGVITATSINQNRNEGSINVPSMASQVKLFKKVLDRAQLRGSQITFVEAHGTGTQVGDCIEAESIRQVFGACDREDMLSLGSVKDNIGHTEGAAGIASLIKALLMVRYSVLAPQAGFQTLNPKIRPLEEDRIQILREPQEWKTGFKAACVNNYGAGGCNAALIICQPPTPSPRLHAKLERYPIIISAKTDVSLKAYCRRLLGWLETRLLLGYNDQLLAHLTFNLSRKQSQDFKHVVAYDVADVYELQRSLNSYVGTSLVAHSWDPSATLTSKPHPVVLTFGGQTGNCSTISRKTVDSCRLLRAHLVDCDTTLKKIGYKGIFPAIYSVDNHDLITSHSVLFSIQYASAKCWLDCGLKVDALIGHSFGHYTALCISGVLSLNHALQLVAERAAIIESAWGPEKGAMIALEADPNALSWLMAALHSELPENSVEVACYNGPSSYVLVGTSALIESLEEIVRTRSPSAPMMRLKRLDIPYGFHSRLTESILGPLSSLADELVYSAPKIPVASCLGEASFPSVEDANTIVMHTRSPVNFTQAIHKLKNRLGPCTWLEAGTGSPIVDMVRRALGESANMGHNFQRVDFQGAEHSLATVTVNLWKQNHKHSFWPFHASCRDEYEDLDLPPYAFETTSHWLPYVGAANLRKSEEKALQEPCYCSFEGFRGPNSKVAIFKIDTRASSFKRMVEGHAVLGIPLCPASVYVDIAVQTATHLSRQGAASNVSELTPELQHLEIEAPLGYDKSRTVHVSLMRKDTTSPEWTFELTSTDEQNATIRHASGRVILQSAVDVRDGTMFASYARLLDIGACKKLLKDPAAHSVSGPVIYTLFERAVNYDTYYRGVRRIASLDCEVAAQIVLPSEDHDAHCRNIPGPLAIDNFLQVAGIHVNYLRRHLGDDVYIANKIDRIMFGEGFSSQSKRTDWAVYSKSSTPDDRNAMNDIFIFDSATEGLAMVLSGVHFSRVPIRSLTKVLSRANGVPAMQPDAELTSKAPAVLPDIRPCEVELDHIVQDAVSTKIDDLRNVLSDLLGVSEEALQLKTTFSDLCIDSLMITELANTIRHSFGVTISTMELQRLGDIQTLSSRLFAPKGLEGDREVVLRTFSPSNSSSKGSGKAVSATSTPQSFTDVSSIDKYSDYHALTKFREVSNQFDMFAKANGFIGYWRDVYPIHSRLVSAYITEAFSALGCQLATLQAGSRVHAPVHHPRHKMLIVRLLEILEQLGLICKVENGNFVRTTMPVESTSSSTLHEMIVTQYPAYAQENQLLRITGVRLADCLSGKADGIDLLFGTKASRKLLESVYSNAPIFKTATRLLAHFLTRVFSARHPSESIEILEIGAGTGGTTRYLVNELKRAGINFTYTFSDVSSSMVFKAKQSFKDEGNMRFRVLDIEDQVPTHLRGRFETVISTNCIHATSNLVESCKNIRSMLSPGGFVGLIELTRRMPWFDLVFGLLEGWWSFSDDRTHALVDECMWSEKLQAAGFGSIAWSSGESKESHDIRVLCAFNTPATSNDHTDPGYEASSVLLQGHKERAKETIFAFPGGFGTASTYTPLPALDPSIAVIGLNSPFLHAPSAFSLTLPELTSLYIAEIRRQQSAGPYTLMGYSVGGVMAYEAARQLMASGEHVRRLVLLDSASPALVPPFPISLLDLFDHIDRFKGTDSSEPDEVLSAPAKGGSANQTKKMRDPHVVATLECLRQYDPLPMANGCSPQTLLIAARQGVDRIRSITRPAVSEMEQTVMEWVLDDRRDFTPTGFGWDRLIHSEKIEVVPVNGNHFSLMTEPSVSIVAEELRRRLDIVLGPQISSREDAQSMDRRDPIQSLRCEFYVPSRADLEKEIGLDEVRDEPIVYLAGSAIGLQPKSVLNRTGLFLDQWARRGILAGSAPGPGVECPSWLEAENVAAKLLAPIVGAIDGEVALMNSLTANMHFLLASFYQPRKSGSKRTRILIEDGAFASDWYALQSQISWHGLDPTAELISIPCDKEGLLSTKTICATIDNHASSTALLILSGVQFHTGQLLEIPYITAYARERGIVVGWDLAHAVGNVELKLHEWNVDFAVWCSYKYLNAGPGATAGVFLHERHGKEENRPRLAGWWGTPAPERFAMKRCFTPSVGAAGLKVSSPSILDITAVTAALSLFENNTMQEIAGKSQRLTNYLESLLQDLATSLLSLDEAVVPWTLITPSDSTQRGAMLSFRWHQADRLEKVVEYLQGQGVIVDVRKPDIMRVTPVAMYNTFEDVWTFAQALRTAILRTEEGGNKS